jgi:hypothetical protein
LAAYFEEAAMRVELHDAAAMAGWHAVCLEPSKIQSICRCRYIDPGS